MTYYDESYPPSLWETPAPPDPEPPTVEPPEDDGEEMTELNRQAMSGEYENDNGNPVAEPKETEVKPATATKETKK